MNDDDATRYIEYFQKAMLTPGTEHRSDHAFALEWLSKSREARAEMAKRYAPQDYDRLTSEFESAAAAFVPKTKYDTFEANSIFSRIISLVNAACAVMTLRLDRPVILAASTALDVSPLVDCSISLST